MATKIHPTALVDSQTIFGEDVEIGPYAIIEGKVTLGDRVQIGPMVHIQGTTAIGTETQILTCSTIGFPPQFIGFDGAQTRTVIGARSIIREHVSIHRALNADGATTIGDDVFLMAYSHVAHDCHLGNQVIVANGALLAGHVVVGDRAFISGNVAVHQFARIGRLAMVSGLSKATQDVPPFMIADGHPARIRSLNVIGMRRAAISAKVRMELKRIIHQIYFSEQTVAQAIALLLQEDCSEQARELLDFYATSKRGVMGYERHRNGYGISYTDGNNDQCDGDEEDIRIDD